MKPPSKTTQLVISASIVFFGFGFLVGSIINQHLISKFLVWEPGIQVEFDIVGLFSLLVTVVLAYYVTRILDTRDGQEKIEKENIIRYFQQFETELTSKMKEIAKDGKELTHVAGVLRRHRMRAAKLVKLAEKHCLLSPSSVLSKKLDSDIKEIIDLMTDTPKKGEVPNGVTVVGGKLKFSEKQIDLIVGKVFDVNSSVFDLIVEINRTQR